MACLKTPRRVSAHSTTDCGRIRHKGVFSAMQHCYTPRPPICAAILAFPDATASVMYGLSDLFHSAGRDWGMIVHGTPGPSVVAPVIVAARAGPLTLANGVTIVPDATLDAAPLPQLVCVPELLIAPSTALENRYADEVEWLKRCYAAGAVIAAACSGSLLLAEAGLLEGESATTHWAYCDVLAERYPGIKVQRQRSLVAAGEGQRLIMAGGGSSWLDLGLFLIARFAGVDVAMQLARLYLIDWHHAGQQPFARLAATRQTDDAVITRCQIWAAHHYASTSPVAAMADVAGLSERALTRRFQKATGMTPLQYVQSIRIEEAKQMLESSEADLETIAQELGYEDPRFLQRLFKREVRLTPAQYRRKFGRLRQVLQTAGN